MKLPKKGRQLASGTYEAQCQNKRTEKHKEEGRTERAVGWDIAAEPARRRIKNNAVDRH